MRTPPPPRHVRRLLLACTVPGLMVALLSCGDGDEPVVSTTAPTEAPSTEPATTARPTTTDDPPADAPTTASTPETTRPRPTAPPGPELPDDVFGIDFSGLDLPTDDAPDDFREVEDDTGTLQIEIPTGWADVDTRPIDEGTGSAPSIWASGDLDRYAEDYDLGGLRFEVVTHESVGDRPADVLDYYAETSAAGANCDDATETDYDDGLYAGTARLWTGCPDGAAILHVAAAPNPSGTWYLGLEIQMATTAHVDVAVRALESFRIVGDVDTALATEESTETRPTPTAPPDAPIGSSDQDRAITILSDHIAACGMDWEDADATDQGSGLWEISVYLLPTPDLGDPGEGLYLVDLNEGSVTSLNGTAGVLCPG